MSKDEKKQLQNLSELLVEAQNGSSEAFAALVDLYSPLLDKETLRYKQNFGYDDYKDIAQGALIAFYRAVLAYNVGSDVTFGLFAKICVVNGIADVLRFINKKSGDLELGKIPDMEIPDAVVDPEELVLDKAQYRHFWRKAAEVLSELEIKVLRLYILGNSYAEIASALGKSEKSVDNALRRAKEKIKMNFSDGSL